MSLAADHVQATAADEAEPAIAASVAD